MDHGCYFKLTEATIKEVHLQFSPIGPCCFAELRISISSLTSEQLQNLHKNEQNFVCSKQDKCKSPNRTNYNSCFHSLYQTFVILSNIQISNMALCTSLDGRQSCTPRYKSITFIFSMGVLYTNERVPICHKYIHDVLLSFEQ